MATFRAATAAFYKEGDQDELPVDTSRFRK